MPLVKSDIPNLILAGLRTIFFQAYESEQGSVYEQVATTVPSDKDTETYAWLGNTPKMREFKDERIPKGLSEYKYTLQNKTWEASLSVDRAAIEDDLYGQIQVRVRELAQEARRHVDQLVVELLPSGFSTVCYDGQYFFDNDHSEGDSGTQTNVTTSVLSDSTLQAGITAMMKFKDDKGKPLGIVPDVLVVPPDLQWTAMELLESPVAVVKVGSGTSGTGATAATPYKNLLQGKLRLLITPYLTDDDSWYLLATNRVVRPLIFQNRTPVEFTSLEANSEAGFMRDAYLYGVRARYNAGYGMWQCAYGGNVS